MIIRKTHNGISYLEKQGNGTPHVFLHGISSDAESFRMLMEQCEFPCSAWDMPGYGQSQDLQDKSIGGYLSALDAIVPQKFMLSGSSMGAIIASNYAAIYPQKVQRLFLISPSSGYALNAQDPLPPSVAARLDLLQSEGADQYAQKRASNLIFEAENRPLVLKSVRRAMAALRVEGLTAASRLLASANVAALSPEIKMPVTFIIGREDNITPLEKVQNLYDHFISDQKEFVLLEGCGHALYQEKPQQLMQVLRSNHG